MKYGNVAVGLSSSGFKPHFSISRPSTFSLTGGALTSMQFTEYYVSCYFFFVRQLKLIQAMI